MRRRTELKCIGSGVLGSFVSRNNDLDGYWALGLMFLYASRCGTLSFRLNLLTGEVQPRPAENFVGSTPDFSILSNRYRVMLLDLLDRRKAPASWLADAEVAIDYESVAARPAYSPLSAVAKPFLCTLTLTDDLARRHVLSSAGWAWKHDPWREMKSARPRKPQSLGELQAGIIAGSPRLLGISRWLGKASLILFVVGLLFRLAIYGQMYIGPDDAYGLSDIIELLLGWVLVVVLVATAVSALILLTKGPKANRITSMWLLLMCGAIVASVGPLHNLAARWAW